MTADARWKATLFYRTEAGPIDIEQELVEVGDIHEIVERGPHWDTLIRIEIVRINHNESETLTVEQAEKL